jgi:hypothetical protein
LTRKGEILFLSSSYSLPVFSGDFNSYDATFVVTRARGKAADVTPKPAMKLTLSLMINSGATVVVGSAASYCLPVAVGPLVIGRTRLILNVSSARAGPVSGAAASSATAQAGAINVGKSFPPPKLRRRPLDVVLVFPEARPINCRPRQTNCHQGSLAATINCHDLAKRHFSLSASVPTIRTLRTITAMAV